VRETFALPWHNFVVIIFGVIIMHRRFISLLAIIGVLLHAGIFVRHNAMMLGAALDQAAFADIFSEICHGGPNSVSPDAPLPQNPSDPESHCPDCLSFVGATALFPAIFADCAAIYSIVSNTFISSDVVRPNILVLWPPGRGPP
jgi:hypothetical protein